jgi:S-adenosylmethionine decarboxylase
VDGGTEWVVDAFDCDPARLRDAARIVALLDGVVADCALQIIGAPAVHVFPGAGGVTALYLLAESHLACHTFPESGVATINLYCCRPRRGPDWRAIVVDALGAARVTVRELARGGAP